MENAPSTEKMERLITVEERERLSRALASLGLYDASQDTYYVTPHPEDRRFAVEFDPNPNIVLGLE